MLKVRKVPWGVGVVILVLILRLSVVFLSDRLILPALGLSPLVVGSLIDRVFLVGLTFYLVFRIYRGGWRTLGLEWSNLARHALLGILVGLGLYVLFLFTRNYLGPVIGQDLQTNPLVRMAAGAGSPLAFAVPLLLGGVMAPVAEEIFYRGLAFPAFSRWLGLLGGLLASAVFFAAMHFTLTWWPEIIIAGMVFAYLYARTNSLYPGMIAHAVVNSVQLVVSFLLR